MPFPRSQLDVYILQMDPFKSIQHTMVQEMFQGWFEQNYIDSIGNPTSSGIEYFGFGTFNKIALDLSEDVRLYANHQGGYRVFCPQEMKLMTATFSESVHQWRSNGRIQSEFTINCHLCGMEHTFNELIGRPSFAFGMGAIRLINVEHSTSGSTFLLDLKAKMGPFNIVLKRVG